MWDLSDRAEASCWAGGFGTTLTTLTALGAALVAGVLLAFSAFVMRAL